MEKVVIIGCGGSGKSTLARALGEKTGLPVVHLDRIYWSPGDWKHLEPAEFDALLALELEKPWWIMDGNFDRTMETRLQYCDTVIWLDYNRLVCIAGWLSRVLRYRGVARPDMGPGCGEKFDPEFLAWIWNFNGKLRKNYQTLLQSQKGKNILIFKNRRQLKRWLEGLR